MHIITKYQCSLFSIQYIEEYSRYDTGNSIKQILPIKKSQQQSKTIILSSPIGYLNQTAEGACGKGAANPTVPYEHMRIVAGPIIIGVSQFKAKEYELQIKNNNIISNISIYSLTG